MRIAITGARGRVGHAIGEMALKQGHSVVAIDRLATGEAPNPRSAPLPPLAGDVREIVANVTDFDALLEAFAGCDALVHMAAIPAPFYLPDDVVHYNNVVGSYNAMRAAVEQGIRKICQASSVNAIGLSFSREPHFDYFPIDEKHPAFEEEPYGLSKLVCEAQADSLARRYEDLRIASMRFHLVAVDRAFAANIFHKETTAQAKHLWGYTRFDAAADACLKALEAPFAGHEVFYIVGPDTTMEAPTLHLARKFFPDVPVRGDLSGHKSFFDSSKAERMLGWKHPLP